MHIYNDRFYDNQSTGSLRSAKIIAPIISQIFSPRSIVDLGCGIGTWLSAFIEMGIDDILGIDGPYVEMSKLLINETNFLAADLGKPILLDRKFDLAISLEVAEHIPDTSATTFVSSLTSLSDIIIFSAALPHQGGENHINEQWPEYWSDKFTAAGYTPIDYLRFKLWNNPDIEFWYRQNIFIYIKNNLVENYDTLRSSAISKPFSLVHPEQYIQKYRTITGLEEHINSQRESIKKLQNRIEEIKDPSKSSTWDAFVFLANTIIKKL